MFVVQYKKFFLWFSTVTVFLAIVSILFFGIPFGTDFRGGTILEISFHEVGPSPDELESLLSPYVSGEISIRETNINEESGYIIRTPSVDEATQTNILAAIPELFPAGHVVERISSIGPSIGEELRSKSLYAILAVLLMIIFYVAFAFRKVSKPVSSWKYGFVAIITLLHDIIVPAGVFAFLGHFAGYEADILFVTALLAILGFSVNDTIVVFDRIRENLATNEEKNTKVPFEEVVGTSLSQTLVRSINTSLTVFISLLFLFIFAGDAVKTFAVTMLVGVIAGSYSSIFLAPPLLIAFAPKVGEK